MWDHPIMSRLLVAACLIALGLAALIVAPSAQSCTVDVDTRACETIGTIILNVVGGALIALGTLASAPIPWLNRWHRSALSRSPG
jgi:hypothetical protein